MAELKTDLQNEEEDIYLGGVLVQTSNLMRVYEYVIKANKIWSESKSQAPSTSPGQSHNVT